MAQVIDFTEYQKHRRLCRKIKIVKPAKRKKPRKKPDRQGHLDSLCGVYSVVNAVNAVHRLSEPDREKLFNRLIATLGKDKEVAKALIEGTSKRHMEAMLESAVKHVRRKHGVTLAVKSLLRYGSDMCLASYWQTLFHFLKVSKKRSIIIGIRGRDDHWTCIRSMTHYIMKLLDSSGAKRLHRRFCRVGERYDQKHYHLIPSQVWGISLKD